MRSLGTEQREAALITAEMPQDVFEGPGRRESLKAFEGVSAKKLNADQRMLLQQLVGEYVRNGNAAGAATQLDAVAASGWDKLYFSWRGSVDPDGMFYYRVHGPRILIEYNRQNENHDHIVVRDPENDYGEDWLAHHYREYHPPMGTVMEDLQKRLGESSGE